MIRLDGGFFLSIPPWGVLDKVVDHCKLWERHTPNHHWIFFWVTLDQHGLLIVHRLTHRVTKAFCGTKGEVKEENISRCLEVLIGL
jgi:hypothetical protein